jgi:hypothetical protein
MRILIQLCTSVRILIQLFTLMRIRMQLFTLAWIRIQLFTLARIRIQLFTLRRIRIQLFTFLCFFISTIGDLNARVEEIEQETRNMVRSQGGGGGVSRLFPGFQCCGSVRIRILLFTLMRIRIQGITPINKVAKIKILNKL